MFVPRRPCSVCGKRVPTALQQTHAVTCEARVRTAVEKVLR